MKNEKRNKKPTSKKPIPNGGRENSRYLPYNKKLKQYSRNLRNNSTRAEITLWNELRAAQLGYTFNRQKPLQKFIVDFYCKPLHLVIEVDGITHWDEEQIKQDKIRQTILEKMEIVVGTTTVLYISTHKTTTQNENCDQPFGRLYSNRSEWAFCV